jgi:oxygen-independent coproporphyrinogen-3 oxidase
MAGYYIHIPFCKQACIYCDFHFSTQLKGKSAMVNALLLEMEQRRDYLQGETVESIYFGGGTPSLLDEAEINNLLNKIRELHPLAENPEITLEANPDDLTPEKLAALKNAGVNRLSIGVQSLHDHDLAYLKRAHDAQRAVECIEGARETGFHDLTLDLIYGIPGQSDEDWIRNLEKAAALGINHFSAYALTVEHRTALERMIEKGASQPVDEEQSARHFMLMQDWAQRQAFIPYEISNFAREGHFARHNSGYWKGMRYTGIGPSAHSFDGISRQWNIANNALFVKNINTSQPYFEREELTSEEQFSEYIMTGMRTIWGCSLAEIAERFGPERAAATTQSIEKFVDAGNAEFIGDSIRLTLKGRLLADHIIAGLI